jgi:hypothetical protein
MTPTDQPSTAQRRSDSEQHQRRRQQFISARGQR